MVQTKNITSSSGVRLFIATFNIPALFPHLTAAPEADKYICDGHSPSTQQLHNPERAQYVNDGCSPSL
jgi:hypothetical protein